MATLKKYSLTNLPEIDAWMSGVIKGTLDDDVLEKIVPLLITSWGAEPYFSENFLMFTGMSMVKCGVCWKPKYSSHTTPVYFGTTDVCEKCMKDYSYCENCKTYILTCDLGNSTHIHYPANIKGNMWINDDEAEVYNADIMVGGSKKMFLRTPQEEMIWKHQKEAKVKTIFSEHKELPFRYFGVELEVEMAFGSPPDMRRRTRKLFNNFAMIKHDGSLSGHGKYGFEIVSVPATLAYHQSGVWDKFYNSLAMFFKESPPAAGLHVHMGLDTIGKITAGKMAVFVNSSKNREFIENLAERGIGVASQNGKIYANVRDNWKVSDLLTTKQHAPDCPWNSKNKKSMSLYEVDKKTGVIKKDKLGHPIIGSIKPVSIIVRPVCRCKDGLHTFDKYQAFNLSTKRPTIELRIFRGTVTQKFLYSALEFVDALADFCSQTSPGCLGYEDFLRWLCTYNASGRTKLYPNLSRHLINKSFIDPPKKLNLSPKMKSVANG